MIMQPSGYTNDSLNSYLVRKIFFKILQAGKIPEHVAFIMDGNRRYSKFHEVPIAPRLNDISPVGNMSSIYTTDTNE